MYTDNVIDIHSIRANKIMNLIPYPSVRANKIININQYSNYVKTSKRGTHSQRVSKLCEALGVAMEWSEAEINKLRISGLLHDIGKNTIDQRIINKPGPLTVQEWNQIKMHPTIGYRILSSSQSMKEIAQYVLYHHERFDGSGYPIGLMQEEIPLISRIISVADAYDAMTNQRTYKRILNKEEAVNELLKNKGTQFDPNIVDIFIKKVLKCYL